MSYALASVARESREPQRRRPPWLALAVAVSLGAHVGAALTLWVEHPPQPEAGVVVSIEIVSDAGSANAAAMNAAASRRQRASAEAAKPVDAPAPQAVAPPVSPRAVSTPATLSPPSSEPPSLRAPAAIDEKPSAVTALRRPAQIPPVPAPMPRLAAPPERAAEPARPRSQTASIPIVAADAAPGAMAPSAGPEAGTTPPRHGFGSAANPIPRYPEIARERGWEGVVHLSVSVTADGRAESVSIAKSSGHAVLDQSALDAVRRWRFEPARRAGVPVSGTITVPIRFRLED